MSEQDSAPGNRSLFFKDKYSANTESELISLLRSPSSHEFLSSLLGFLDGDGICYLRGKLSVQLL